MKKFKIGVIGCGRISKTYRDIFLKMHDTITVVIAIDKDLARASEFASNFPNCRAATTLTELLEEDLDAVHVLTPHHLHHAHVIACLNAGLHVLCEKPIAISMQDAYEMCEVAKKSNKQLGIIFQNRYIEGVQHLAALIQSKTFGKITGAWSHLAWHRPPSYYDCDWKGYWRKEGGGVVIDQAIHSIDLVRYLMGCEATSVQGHVAQRILTSIEVEDVADAAITFENGAVYSFFACNYFTLNEDIRIELSGEHGTALLTGNSMEIRLNNKPPYTINCTEESMSGESYWGVHHEKQIADFYQKLSFNEIVNITPEDATKTLEIVLSIYQSSFTNRTITL